MSSLLIQEVPLMVLPTLATKIGLNEAMFLQQLHYWIDRSKYEMEGHRWIYNTIEDWCKQFPFWSRQKLLEQKKPIQNPAGWLRCALEEQYADAGADLEKVRQEKQADTEAKNQARKEFYERQLSEEQEKDRTEVDESKAGTGTAEPPCTGRFGSGADERVGGRTGFCHHQLPLQP